MVLKSTLKLRENKNNNKSLKLEKISLIEVEIEWGWIVERYRKVQKGFYGNKEIEKDI